MDSVIIPSRDTKAWEVITLPLSEITSFSYQSVDPISDEMLSLLYKIFNACILFISFTGMYTNILTLRTFYRMRLENSMTVCFFFLAVLDFGRCIIGSAIVVCDVCNILVIESLIKVDIAPYIPYFYLTSSRMFFNKSVGIIKAYMAIQRCLCVTLPFRVGGLFTKCRTYIFLGISSGIIFSWTLIYICGHTLKMVTIQMYNITYPTIKRREEIKNFVEKQEFISSVIYSTINQTIAFTCFIIMVIVLKKSVRFRKSATANILSDSSSKEKSSEMTNNVGEKCNSKERQVLIQVAFLIGIHCCAVAPHFVQGFAMVLVPGYEYNSAYHNLYTTIHGCAWIGEILSATVNLFVYLKYNSKFRECLLHFTQLKKDKSVNNEV